MSKPAFIVEDRLMMSRANAGAITVTNVIPHGVTTYGCCACCFAPACLPGCATFPCCKDPEYIIKEIEASKYIYIRENSIEWNSPHKTSKEGNFCGQSCCTFRAQDQVNIIYFDDPMFDRINDDSRCCNGCLTSCCGGEGERVRIDSKFCMGCCYRSPAPCPFTPVCCSMCFPVIKHTIWVEKADQAIRDIKMSRDNAKARMDIR